MFSQHRKLMSGSINETSKYDGDCKQCSPYCLSYCSAFCPNLCPLPQPSYVFPPPPPPPPVHTTSIKPIVTTIFFTAFFVLLCYRCYVKSLSNRQTTTETVETIDEFLDEGHGPIIEHPIEHINTCGLQQSIVDSIAVVKYKRGEGIVEGTDCCSVCLNEFKEDESLRLLPKCSHAFHVHCIDTWIKSHTTCPMCRAPIVLNDGNKGQMEVVRMS